MKYSSVRVTFVVSAIVTGYKSYIKTLSTGIISFMIVKSELLSRIVVIFDGKYLTKEVLKCSVTQEKCCSSI